MDSDTRTVGGTGLTPLPPSVASPFSLVKDVFFVTDLIAHECAPDGVELELVIGATPYVTADRWTTRRALLSSFLALRPIGPGKLRLELHVEAYMAVVRLSRRDVPIAAAELARLQGALPTAASRAEAGTLVETARLVATVGGLVHVESERESGTTVTIRLPLAASRPPRTGARHGEGTRRGDDACRPNDPSSPCA